MLKRSDLIDLFLRHLSAAGTKSVESNISHEFKEESSGLRPLKGRLFLSEYDIKKALTPGQKHLTIPSEAIVSPLALDWLALKEISIYREKIG